MSFNQNIKRQRLSTLCNWIALREVGVSDSALARILAKVNADRSILDAVQMSSHNDLRLAIQMASNKVSSEADFTISLPQNGAVPFQWSVMHTGKLIRMFARDCSYFASAISTALRRSGGKLNLILYQDEITPGNVLRPDNKKKSNSVLH